MHNKVLNRFIECVIQSRVRRELARQKQTLLKHDVDVCPISFETLDDEANYPYMLLSNPNPVFYSAQSLASYWTTTKKFLDPLAGTSVSCVDVWCVSWLVDSIELLHLYRSTLSTCTGTRLEETNVSAHTLYIITNSCIKLGRVFLVSGFPTPGITQCLRDLEMCLYNTATSSSLVRRAQLQEELMCTLIHIDHMRVYIDPDDLHIQESDEIIQRIANIITDVLSNVGSQSI